MTNIFNFEDLKDSVVDREYVINKMNLISEDRMKRDRSLGLNSNKVLIVQSNVPNPKSIKMGEYTIIKEVAR